MGPTDISSSLLSIYLFVYSSVSFNIDFKTRNLLHPRGVPLLLVLCLESAERLW